jgi:glycosyltransferase involved in cell wall biosynthesis
VAENLHVFRYPMWAPVSGRAPLKQLFARARGRAIRSALRRLQMERPIVWIARPDMQEVLEELPALSLVIYHVVDEYSAYYGIREEWRQRIVAAEQKLMARADLVLVVSESLYAAKKPFNASTHLVANGVDYELYASALKDPSLPAKLAAIEPPRLGYIGHIGERLDFAALMAAAEAHPEWSFVFIGDVHFAGPNDGWNRFETLPNVHYLGVVGVREVPHYVKGFQVGLMPYLPDEHSRNVSPLKLYDYFAAGIPVVSSDIPAAREFAKHVHLSNGGSDYEARLRDALADVSPDRRRERLALAREASWERRANRISELIEARLAN